MLNVRTGGETRFVSNWERVSPHFRFRRPDIVGKERVTLFCSWETHAQDSDSRAFRCVFPVRLAMGSPRVVSVDEEILTGTYLLESLRELTAAAPVILVAGDARQNDVARLVAEGNFDFVLRAGDFAALAVSLVERRLRWAERSETPLGAP